MPSNVRDICIKLPPHHEKKQKKTTIDKEKEIGYVQKSPHITASPKQGYLFKLIND